MHLEKNRETNYNDPKFKARFEPRTATIRIRDISLGSYDRAS